ncbi:MAG: potassium channel family protein [Planctomycetaceae bacterium]
MRKIAVIGLGRFGMTLARQMAASGVEVIAVDRDRRLVDEIKDDVDIAVRLDATDEASLHSQDIDKVDVCVVSIGENFEAALLATVLARRLDIPRVICRAQTQFHAEIFQQIGADEVIQPEMQAGEYLARKLANPQIEDFISLADGYTLIELKAPRPFQGKTLQELALRGTFGVNLVAIKRTTKSERDGETVETTEITGVPKASDVIQSGDTLVLVGSDEALARLPKE